MRINLPIDVVHQVIKKNVMFKDVVMVFNFSKKDSITRLAMRKTQFDYGVLLKAFYSFVISRKFLKSLFIASSQLF